MKVFQVALSLPANAGTGARVLTPRSPRRTVNATAPILGYGTGSHMTYDPIHAGAPPDLPLFLITSPYVAHCMGACSAKREWSLFSLSHPPPPFTHNPNHTVLPI